MTSTEQRTYAGNLIETEAPAAEASKEIITQEQTIVNDYDIDAYLEKRKEFITKVNKTMVEGKDYHVIQGKKSLAKGGAEKIASIFGWTARFEKDTDVLEAFEQLRDSGLVAFICRLSKSDVVVGEGRGAALLIKNENDANKTIKMAQKSAFIDAVLRSSGLSDFFTQDLEDMDPKQFTKPVYKAPVPVPTTPAKAAEIMQGEVVSKRNLMGADYIRVKGWIEQAKDLAELESIQKDINFIKKAIPVMDLAKLRTDFAVQKQKLNT